MNDNQSVSLADCYQVIAKLELEKEALRKENALLYRELVEVRNIARGMVQSAKATHP